MATSPVNTNRLFDGGKSFILGVNSNLHPADLSPAQAAWGVNVVNKGGIWATRPGYNDLYRLPDGKAQGCTFFTPTGGQQTLVQAVSGRIYVSQFPFVNYTLLNNIQFDPYVDHISFKEAVQGVDQNGNLQDPRALLFMQDGLTRPAFWDGQIDRHTFPGGSTNETIIGLWMEWVGGRLWVARGREFFASDIFDPLHFTETQYLTGGGSLQAMDGDVITAMRRTADNRALLVFTIRNTTIVQANITDRSQWATSPSFLTFQFPGVGCVGGKALVDNDGELWWFSLDGVRRFTQTGEAIRTSKNSVQSIEMDRSFKNMSPIMSRICAFSCGTYIGFSVPSGDIFNRHTWVLDTSIESQLGSDVPPAWLGIWMGTRPVEWATGYVNGMEICLHISQDTCGIRIWEAFQAEQEDNGTQIFCSVESNGMKFGEDIAFKKFLFSELHLYGVSGNVEMTCEYKGDYGCWKEIMSVALCATDCYEEIPCPPPVSTILPQNRYLKTQDTSNGLVCESAEGPYTDNIGTFFQNRFRWYGKNGLRMFRSHASQFQENSLGACAESDAECVTLECCDQEVNYVSFAQDGYAYGSSNQVFCSI